MKWLSRKFLPIIVLTGIFVAIFIRFLITPEVQNIYQYLVFITPTYVSALLIYGGLNIAEKRFTNGNN